MKKQLITILFLMFSICVVAQVESPRFKGDSLHYKLDTTSTQVESIAHYDVYNQRLLKWNNHWWSAEITIMPGYKDLKVFIHESSLVKTYQYRTEIEKYYKPAKAQNLAYLKQLQLKYGKNFGEYIYHETPLIGMTQKMVALCIGYPNKINTTKVRGSISEQWIYVNKYDKSESSYYYFDNYRLTAIQD